MFSCVGVAPAAILMLVMAGRPRPAARRTCWPLCGLRALGRRGGRSPQLQFSSPSSAAPRRTRSGSSAATLGLPPCSSVLERLRWISIVGFALSGIACLMALYGSRDPMGPTVQSAIDRGEGTETGRRGARLPRIGRAAAASAGMNACALWETPGRPRSTRRTPTGTGDGTVRARRMSPAGARTPASGHATSTTGARRVLRGSHAGFDERVKIHRRSTTMPM